MNKVSLLSRGSLELHSQDSCETAAHLMSKTFPKLPTHARTGVKTSEKSAPRIRLLALPMTLFKQSTDFIHEGNMVYRFKKLRNLDSDVTLHSWNTSTLPSEMTVLQSPLLTENSNNEEIVNGAIWDKTQMLLQGCTGHRYPHSHQKRLAHLCPHFNQTSRDPPQLNMEGCQLASSSPDRFLISGEKRKKTRLKKVGIGAFLCCLPFFNNFVGISGHWHFRIMAKYLLYQTACYFRLTCFPPHWLGPQWLQGRPLREIENSHIK